MATRTDSKASERTADASSANEAALGRSADKPTEIPAKGWKAVLLRTKEQVKSDNVSILAAGVAFYLLLALAPALVAALSVYGLVSEPADAQRHITEMSSGLPTDVQDLLKTQMKAAASSSGSTLGLTLVFSVLAALLSASKGAKSLVETVNIAFDEEETRGFLRVRLLALAFTVGFVVLLLVAIVLMTVLPNILGEGGDIGRTIGNVLRWPLLALLMIAAIAALFRFAPDRDNPQWDWVTPGATVTLVLWLVGTVLFQVYAGFAKFADTYGTFASVMATMLWLFIIAFAILVGAEINAESERQTREDTTEGPEKPLGARGARAADTLGGIPSKKKGHKATS